MVLVKMGLAIPVPERTDGEKTAVLLKAENDPERIARYGNMGLKEMPVQRTQPASQLHPDAAPFINFDKNRLAEAFHTSSTGMNTAVNNGAFGAAVPRAPAAIAPVQLGTAAAGAPVPQPGSDQGAGGAGQPMVLAGAPDAATRMGMTGTGTEYPTTATGVSEIGVFDENGGTGAGAEATTGGISGVNSAPGAGTGDPTAVGSAGTPPARAGVSNASGDIAVSATEPTQNAGAEPGAPPPPPSAGVGRSGAMAGTEGAIIVGGDPGTGPQSDPSAPAGANAPPPGNGDNTGSPGVTGANHAAGGATTDPGAGDSEGGSDATGGGSKAGGGGLLQGGASDNPITVGKL